ELVTDAAGVATVLDIPNGPYILEEVEAPIGYLLGAPVEILINNKNGEEFTYTYTNSPKLKEITVKKVWQDHQGHSIDPQQNIIIQLLANGEVIKQGRLNKGDEILTFKKLLPYDKNGNIIKYEIKEILLDGFTNIIEAGKDTDFIITNIKDEPTPVEPVEPTPVEPVEPTPVEPTPVEPVEPTPVEPVEPAPVEPVEPTPVEPVEPAPVEPVEPTPVTPPVEVEEVLGESINLSKVPVVDTLPNTGQSNNSIVYYSLILIGLILKRKDN
ncbi:MAG TPA: Cna B-type domain-containing protein, partial [Erysipelothrix sp.]